LQSDARGEKTVKKSLKCIKLRRDGSGSRAEGTGLDNGVASVYDVSMANKVTGVRLPDADVEFLEAWAASENSKQQGPKWTVAYLIQRAVRELIDRRREMETARRAGAQ